MLPLPWIHFLKDGQQLLIESPTRRRVVNGPAIAVVGPLEKAERREGICLGPTDYARVCDRVTGVLRNEVGPKMLFLGPNDVLDEMQKVIPLKKNEYLKIVDRLTGVIRVARGESVVILSPTEVMLGAVVKGISIDEHTAVILRNIHDGDLLLVSEPQMFVPAANQEIVEVRSRILLEDHEAVVVRDREGGYQVRTGRDQQRSFFLDPYASLVQFRWSTGIGKDTRSLQITHLDTRPKFMWYEFMIRTQDNVELMLSVTVFWQIVDVAAMLRSTDDAPGDLCSHARSAIIQAVSTHPLEKFLLSFNSIVAQAVMGNNVFYTDRGIRLHAIEVRSVECRDEKTQQVLQEIIQETTNRLNRLAKQESENEIRLSQVNGDIDAERVTGELLTIKHQNAMSEAQTAGAAEAARAAALLTGLGDFSAEDKLAVFFTLRKQDMLSQLSKGNAQLFFTPDQANISIETQAARA